MLMTSPANVILPELPHHDAFVRLEKVTLTYGRGARTVRALDATALDLGKGGFLALVGT